MLRKALQKITQDTFLKNNIIFFISSLFVAFLNYLYHPVIGRMITVEQFGEVQTILSFVFLSGVMLTVFRMIVLDISKNNEENKENTSSLFTLAVLIHMPILLFLIIGSPFLSSFFSFSTSWSFALFSLCLALSIPHTFYSSHLNGKNNFLTLSISNIIPAAGKILISAIFIYLGFAIYGAILGLLISSLISIIYIRYNISGFHISLQKNFIKIKEIIRKEISYATLIITSLSLITFLYSGDILIVKHFFSPEIAGAYAGIATIARIIFFITASVSAVMISSVKISNTKSENKIIFIKGLKIILLVGGLTSLFFILFPKFVISILLGEKYLSLVTLLPLLSVSLFLISVLNLFVSYFLALRDKELLRISVITSIAFVLLLCYFNNSIKEIIISFILTSSLALTLLFCKIYK
jgi:O-antigen/teichoic acid export membrane protein